MIKPRWSECPRDSRTGQWSAPYITLNSKGWFSIGRITWERTGSPEAYILLFDSANSRIGLKPALKSSKNAYPARRFGPHGGRYIRAYRLLQEFGIQLAETIRFVNPEQDEEGILMLDLRTAKLCPRGIGQRARFDRQGSKLNAKVLEL